MAEIADALSSNEKNGEKYIVLDSSMDAMGALVLYTKTGMIYSVSRWQGDWKIERVGAITG